MDFPPLGISASLRSDASSMRRIHAIEPHEFSRRDDALAQAARGLALITLDSSCLVQLRPFPWCQLRPAEQAAFGSTHTEGAGSRGTKDASAKRPMRSARHMSCAQSSTACPFSASNHSGTAASAGAASTACFRNVSSKNKAV